MAYGLLSAQSAGEALDLVSVQDGVGVRALGMGNAYSAVADDYTAVYWNPAGLGQIKRIAFNVNMAHTINGNESSYIKNNLNTDQTATRIHSIGIAYPFDVYRGSFVIGFGYNVLRNFDGFNRFSAYNTASNGLYFDYDNGDRIYFDKNVLQEYSINREGKLSSWNVAAALALSPRFTVGANLAFLGGGKDYALDYTQTDINDLYVLGSGQVDYYSYALQQRLHQSFSGVAFKLAGMFELSDALNLSTVITFPVALNVNEEWSEKDQIAYDDPSVPVDEYDLGSYAFDYIITTPYRFHTGISFNTGDLILAGSVEYVDWSQLRYTVPDGRDRAEYDDLLLENQTIREDFKPVLSYSLGGELALFHRTLFLRGGYAYSPVADRVLDKSHNRQSYSAGLGYAVDSNTRLNVAYAVHRYKQDMRYIYTTDTVTETINNVMIRAGIDYTF